MLNGLDLFTGIGGFAIGLEDYVRPIAYCERDAYCLAVLLERMRENKIPVAPICTDIRELRSDCLPEVDIITAGFPCQDVSVAGLRKGLGGERTKLFWEVVRLTKEASAPFVFLENVQGISPHIPTIRNAFEEIGYSVRDGFLSAADVGANHKRERWFLLAYSDGPGLEGLDRATAQYTKFTKQSREKWWKVEPNVGRVVDGLPNRVDRIKSLGNAVVPEQARKAFEILMGC